MLAASAFVTPEMVKPSCKIRIYSDDCGKVHEAEIGNRYPYRPVLEKKSRPWPEAFRYTGAHQPGTEANVPCCRWLRRRIATKGSSSGTKAWGASSQPVQCRSVTRGRTSWCRLIQIPPLLAQIQHVLSRRGHQTCSAVAPNLDQLYFVISLPAKARKNTKSIELRLLLKARFV